MRKRPLVFGVGLNKTATTSLALATEQLGLRTCHHGGTRLDGQIQRAVDTGRPLFHFTGWRIRRTDVFFDVGAIQRHFARFDREFPGSRFILSVRDLDSWLESREQHVLRNQQKAAAGTYKGRWLEVDREAWTAHWHSHHERVLHHFEGRDDLLVIDVFAGDGWEQLAPFLGFPVPDVPFPHVNRTPV